ncbi:MAG: PmoA family protein [Planctomycetota bacterium]
MPTARHTPTIAATCLLLLGGTLSVASESVEPVAPCCAAPGRFAHLVSATTPQPQIAVEESKHGLRVLINGELFAEYRTDNPHQPAIWPIIGPSGHEMTRSYPLGPAREGERKDHPHHESLWFAHGGVNGHDFWHIDTNRSSDQRPRIEHQKVLAKGAASGEVSITTTNAWLAGDEVQLTDRRHVAFGVLPSDDGDDARYIDFTIELHASAGPVTFGDTKEGTFGIRVPGVMKADAGKGGRFFNNDAAESDAAWGQPAAWVAYEGPLEPAAEDADTPKGGIVIMSHPGSGGLPCRWHVRSYGLFAANPFGVIDFPHDESATGGYELADGESLTLRYRVVLHAGASDPSGIDAWYKDFAATDLTTTAE